MLLPRILARQLDWVVIPGAVLLQPIVLQEYTILLRQIPHFMHALLTSHNIAAKLPHLDLVLEQIHLRQLPLKHAHIMVFLVNLLLMQLTL